MEWITVFSFGSFFVSTLRTDMFVQLAISLVKKLSFSNAQKVS